MHLIVKTYKGEEIIRNSKLMLSVVKTYKEVFTRKGESEWGENWTTDEVKEYLTNCFRQPNSANEIALLIDESKNSNNVVGFHIGHIGLPKDVLLHNQMPKDLSNTKKQYAVRIIKEKLNNELQILYDQDLGVLHNYRNGAKRLTKLFLPLMEIAIQNRVKYTIYWTSRKSRLYNLSKIVNAKNIYSFNDAQENVVLLFSVKRLINVCKLSESKIVNYFLSLATN